VALGVGGWVAVGLGVADGVAELVGVGLAVAARVALSAGTAVSGTIAVLKSVGSAVGVGDRVAVRLEVPDGVAVADSVPLPPTKTGTPVELGEGYAVAVRDAGTTGVSVSVAVTTGELVGVAEGGEGTTDGVSVAEGVGEDEATGDGLSLGDGVTVLLGVAVGESRPMAVVPVRLMVEVTSIVELGDGTGGGVAAKIGVTASRATARSTGPPPTPSGSELCPGAPPR